MTATATPRRHRRSSSTTSPPGLPLAEWHTALANSSAMTARMSATRGWSTSRTRAKSRARLPCFGSPGNARRQLITGSTSSQASRTIGAGTSTPHKDVDCITASLSSQQCDGLDDLSVTLVVLTVTLAMVEHYRVARSVQHFSALRSIVVVDRRRVSVRPERIETFRARYLRRELARLREQAGLSMEDVAERTDISKPKLSRIETGKIGVSPSDLRLLLDAYDVTDDASREMLLTFARHARRRGWWYRYA